MLLFNILHLNFYLVEFLILDLILQVQNYVKLTKILRSKWLKSEASGQENQKIEKIELQVQRLATAKILKLSVQNLR